MKISRQNSKSMILDRQKSRVSEHQAQDKNTSYLDLSIDDGDIDINETIKEKQTLRRLRSQKQLSAITMKNGSFAAEEAKDQSLEPDDQWKKGFMDGFRNYIGMKKSQRNLSLGDLDLIKEFNSHSKKNKDQLLAQQLLGSPYSELVGDDLDSASGGGSSNKIELNKRRQQTAKILAEMNKKLRISQKSKQDKFDDSMQVFKKTETYIEIRPFLEKMNIHNSNNYLVQVNDIEKSIAQAKQKQSYNKMAHQEELERSLSTFEQIGTPRDLTEKDVQLVQLQQAKSAQSLIHKANEALVNSNTKHTFRSLHNSIMSKLIDELGLAPDDSYSLSHAKISLEKQIQQMESNQQSALNTNNASQQPQLSSSQAPIKQTHQSKVNKFYQERDGRDLASDENQFFENLGKYLGKAQMDINYKEEVAAELSAFQEVIEAGQKKLEELRQKQFKGFIGPDGKMIEAFESGKNLTTEQYHQQFREKALQARLALNKVNKALFQKKWANSQMKRKMERQRERNELFSKLGISLNGENTHNHSTTDDLINPSRRMNQRILAAKLQHEQMHVFSEQHHSQTVTSGIPTIEEEDDQNASPREEKMNLAGKIQRKSIYSRQKSANRKSASKSIYQQQQIQSLLQIDNINNGSSGNQQQFTTNEAVVNQNPQSFPSMTTNNMNSNAELSSVDNGIPGFQVNTKKRDSYNFQEDGLSHEFQQEDDYGNGEYITQPQHQTSIKDAENTRNNNNKIQETHEKNESNNANATDTTASASSLINTKLPKVSHSRSSSNYSIMPSTAFHSKKNSMPKLPSVTSNNSNKLPQINTSHNSSYSSNRLSESLYQLHLPEKNKLSMLHSPSRLSVSNVNNSKNQGNLDGSRRESTKNDETSKSMFASSSKQKDTFQSQKLDKIINDIDSEHTEYVVEKTKIKDKLQMICETIDKDMRKYEQQQYVESIRDVNTDISLKNYHSGSRASILAKFPRNKINL